MAEQEELTAAEPIEVMLGCMNRHQAARELSAAADEMGKRAQQAHVEANRSLSNAIATGGVQIGKVYVVEWNNVRKAVRIIHDRERSKSGRSDDRDHLKLEIMDMA